MHASYFSLFLLSKFINDILTFPLFLSLVFYVRFLRLIDYDYFFCSEIVMTKEKTRCFYCFFSLIHPLKFNTSIEQILDRSRRKNTQLIPFSYPYYLT